MSCPRCQAAKVNLRTEYEGKEAGKVVWTVYHCRRCAFTWRDTELPESIDYQVRDAWFRVDPDNKDQYDHNIPPAKTQDP